MKEQSNPDFAINKIFNSAYYNQITELFNYLSFSYEQRCCILYLLFSVRDAAISNMVSVESPKLKKMMYDICDKQMDKIIEFINGYATAVEIKNIEDDTKINKQDVINNLKMLNEEQKNASMGLIHDMCCIINPLLIYHPMFVRLQNMYLQTIEKECALFNGSIFFIIFEPEKYKAMIKSCTFKSIYIDDRKYFAK
jgi:hypothetical protein